MFTRIHPIAGVVLVAATVASCRDRVYAPAYTDELRRPVAEFIDLIGERDYATAYTRLDSASRAWADTLAAALPTRDTLAVERAGERAGIPGTSALVFAFAVGLDEIHYAVRAGVTGAANVLAVAERLGIGVFALPALKIPTLQHGLVDRSTTPHTGTVDVSYQFDDEAPPVTESYRLTRESGTWLLNLSSTTANAEEGLRRMFRAQRLPAWEFVGGLVALPSSPPPPPPPPPRPTGLAR